MKIKKLIFKRDNCRLCNSKNIKCVLNLIPTPIGESYIPKELLNEKQEIYPVDLFLCEDCGHTQLGHVINPKELYDKYIYKTSHSLGLVDHFEKYADSVLKKVNPPKGKLVVDIGSNDGSLLMSFKNRGMTVLGIDPAIDIAKQATESGIETMPLFFNVETAKKIKKEKCQPHIITANNVFANIDDLDEIVKAVKELLSPEGVFIFETGYVFNVLQKVIFDNIYHEHLSYFSVKPAKSFFKKYGFELIDVEYIHTKGGSMRCMVQFAKGPRKVLPSIDNFIKIESDFGIQKAETYKFFERNINDMKNQTINLLKNLKVKGRKIIGYGASVTVTGILYNFNINKDILDFIVDDNPIRQNLYSPGLHIPILFPQKIYEENPDYIIILAWQYAKPIINKHKKYLEQGGNFILFSPQLKIINKYNWKFEK